MPVYETPAPIDVQIELTAGDIRITAAEGVAETSVEVVPTNPAKPADVAAAEQTRVELAAGRLTVRAPRTWRRFTPFSDAGSVDVRIELPAGSTLAGRADLAALQVSGRLGRCRFATGMGSVQLDGADVLDVRTGAGDVTIGHAGGATEISTGSGKVRIDVGDGATVIKNSNGDCWIGDARSDLRIVAANGDIRVDRSQASVVAKTAHGDIRLDGLVRGAVVAETAYGQLDIGIADGSAAYLDLHTSWGQVRSELDETDAPAAGQDTVDVRAKTAFGDITVRRS